MHSLILHIISKSHPLWQVHAKSHLTHHIKIPPPLASTCAVSSYTSSQNPIPSGNYMHSLVLSHLTHHIKIPPPLASTCTVSSYTSYQNPTPSGNYMHSLILSHLTHHIKIPPPSGKYMHSLILHIISKSHPFWQLHAQSHLVSSYTSYQNPTLSGKYMRSLILHVISKSHPLLGKYMHSLIFHVISKSHQVHAQSHPPKIPPPLASTCTVSSYTSYQNPTPSGKYMHVSSYNLKIPPPLASTCTVSSYTSYQNPTPSGKYMHSLILHVISKSHPLWQVHAQSHLTHHIKIPPPLASTCTVSSYT